MSCGLRMEPPTRSYLILPAAAAEKKGLFRGTAPYTHLHCTSHLHMALARASTCQTTTTPCALPRAARRRKDGVSTPLTSACTRFLRHHVTTPARRLHLPNNARRASSSSSGTLPHARDGRLLFCLGAPPSAHGLRILPPPETRNTARAPQPALNARLQEEAWRGRAGLRDCGMGSSAGGPQHTRGGGVKHAGRSISRHQALLRRRRRSGKKAACSRKAGAKSCENAQPSLIARLPPDKTTFCLC